MSYVITCYAQASKNPFEKTHPIGADYFLKTDANRIGKIIKKGREKVKAVDFDTPSATQSKDFKKAEEYFERADRKIQIIRPGEKDELKQKKESLIQSLKEARLFLVHYRNFVEVNSLFGEGKELEDTNWAEQRSKLKDAAFRQFLLQQYSDDEYKTGWVYLVTGDYEKAMGYLANVPSQNANYLRGVAQLEKAHELRREPANSFDDVVREYEAAEKIFSSEEFHEPVLSLVKNKWGIANAYRIWLTLEEKVFGKNARREDLIKYWEEIWLLIPDIGEGLPAINSDAIQSPLEVVALETDKEKSGFKLGWFYSAIGWYEKATQYFEDAIEKIPLEDRFYAYYFYGRAKEAMYVPNALREQLSEFDQTQVQATHLAYSEALKYAQNGQFDPKIEDYMKRCRKALGRLFETQSSRPNAHLVLERYKAAFRECAENFYIEHQLMDFFRRDWSHYDKLGFSFHGPDGYYSVYFDGRDKALYENSIKLISLLQLFLSRNYVTISEDRWRSYYSSSQARAPAQAAKFPDASIETSIREVLENEFLGGQIFSGDAIKSFSLAKSLSLGASSPEDWNHIMINLATAVDRQSNQSGGYLLGNLTGKKKPFSYVEALCQRASLYEEKGIWAKAAEYYVKSLSLIPTGEAYEKLGALLLRISEQNPSDAILQNANFCMEQAGKLRQSEFPGR